MSTASLGSYYRTIITVAVVLLATAFLFSSLRVDAWVGLKPFFEWMGTTWFGVIGTTWGAVFAVVQAFHLLAMALMGGAIIVSDGRLLGLGFSEMDERDQSMVRMKYFQDLKYQEIADKLGMSVGNVGYRLHHLLKDLGERLRKFGISHF